MKPEELQRLAELENKINSLIKSDRYLFIRNLDLFNVSIGLTVQSKLSVYGVTPIVQQGAITVPSGGATVDSQSRVAIGSLITALKNFGITA